MKAAERVRRLGLNWRGKRGTEIPNLLPIRVRDRSRMAETLRGFVHESPAAKPDAHTVQKEESTIRLVPAPVRRDSFLAGLRPDYQHNN